MNKIEYIKKNGEDAWLAHLKQKREYRRKDNRKNIELCRGWREEHPEQIKLNGREQNRKGGKYYEKTVEYNRTGLRGERNSVRGRCRHRYRRYKMVIAPESQLHFEWAQGTAEYKGIALVEADQHRHGIIDVIQILEGEITLFTEKEITEAPCRC